MQSSIIGIDRRWREDYSNGVIACSSCNSFDNQFRLPASFAGRTYTTSPEFYQLRDEVFLLRKERILALIEAERVFFDTNYEAEPGWREVIIDEMTAADEDESGCGQIADQVAVQQARGMDFSDRELKALMPQPTDENPLTRCGGSQ